MPLKNSIQSNKIFSRHRTSIEICSSFVTVCTPLIMKSYLCYHAVAAVILHMMARVLQATETQICLFISSSRLEDDPFSASCKKAQNWLLQRSETHISGKNCRIVFCRRDSTFIWLFSMLINDDLSTAVVNAAPCIFRWNDWRGLT